MENFIVSARKYRPATFRSVVGQNHITSTLRNAISRGQLAHAYLFCGPRGVGKTTCARIFAKAINCTDPRTTTNPDGTPGFEACGECESCRSFDEGRSFGIHELDAASNNSVDDIRSLTEQVRIPPQVGRYSVYIIDEVHMLSPAAFNAFLKTLEEPPAHAIFILATTEKHKIIPTILSRCQIFDFNRIKVSDGVDYMKHIASREGVAYDEESLNLIARKADGGMRDALSMFDKAVSFCGNELRYKEVAQSLNILDYDTYFDAVETILAGDYGAALMMFDRVLALGFSGQTFMSGMGSHLRDLLVAKNPRTAELLDVTGPLLHRYEEQAARCTVDFLFGAIALLTDLDAKVRIATNQRLLVELALMKLCRLATPDPDPEKKAGTPAADYNSPEKKNSDRLAPEAALPPLRPSSPPRTETPPAAEVAADRRGYGVAEKGVCSEYRTHTFQPSGGGMEAHTTGSAIPSAAAATYGEVQTGRVDLRGVSGSPTPLEAATTTGSATSSEAGSQPTPPEAATVTGSPTSPEAASLSTSGFQLLTISGRPLSEIMAGTAPSETPEHQKAAETPIDPEAAEKIERHREKFLAKLAAERPRIGVAYETMETTGNTVRVRVASTTLRDEVLRHRTETLHLLAAVAGVHGPIELEVVVDDTVKPSKPIRPEDKLRHLSELNPELNTLRKALDLEIE